MSNKFDISISEVCLEVKANTYEEAILKACAYYSTILEKHPFFEDDIKSISFKTCYTEKSDADVIIDFGKLFKVGEED